MNDPKYEIARASIVEAPERDAEQFSECNTGPCFSRSIVTTILIHDTKTDNISHDIGDEDDPIYLHSPALLKRIGAQGIILLSLGTLCLLAVLGLLSYLWFGGPYSGYVWRRVVLSDWAPRVASLLAEMARIILSLQAILATSMIASIALESGTVALSKAPAVLIMRFANTGPLMLARNLLAGTIRRKKRSKWMREDVAIWMILPVVGTFVVSQFLSPLVVSDFESDLVVGERGEVNVSEGLQMVNGARNYMNKKVSRGVGFGYNIVSS